MFRRGLRAGAGAWAVPASWGVAVAWASARAAPADTATRRPQTASALECLDERGSEVCFEVMTAAYSHTNQTGGQAGGGTGASYRWKGRSPVARRVPLAPPRSAHPAGSARRAVSMGLLQA